MELVVIGAHAEGYRSGAIHEEEVAITKESYDKLKEEIDEISVYVSELDGKHSEVKADMDVIFLNGEEEISEYGYTEYDEESVYYDLEEIFDDAGIDLQKELDSIDKYLKSIDINTTFEVTVKESLKREVLEFIEKLNGLK